ncbi:MAG: glycosyltransferase family 4 protein [Clostridiales bacterium]|nr:glycosyltransferase family 4 protein [Clostridiales bacterium]
MLGHKRIPSREGGVEITIEQLAVRMVAQGHQVICYNRKGHHVSGKQFSSAQLLEHQGVQLKTVPAINLRGIAAMSASVFASIRAAFGRYDIVHYHTEGPCAMLWLPKLLGKRCVATVHGLDHQRSKWGRFAKAYIRLGEKCAARYADEIIVLSDGVKNYFMETYQRQTTLIPNGVIRVVPRSADLIRKEFGLEKDGYILFLGRITPEKGVHDLITAYGKLATDKKLVIAGGSSDTDGYVRKLKQMAEGNPNIIFTNFVQGQMLDELYSNAYLYVLPSDLEGMPLSLLEALSFGNCCLVSDIPENADLVQGCGFTFQTGDTDSLAGKLDELLQDPSKVEQCRQAVSKHLNAMEGWDDVTNRTLQVYQDVCDGINAAT